MSESNLQQLFEAVKILGNKIDKNQEAKELADKVITENNKAVAEENQFKKATAELEAKFAVMEANLQRYSANSTEYKNGNSELKSFVKTFKDFASKSYTSNDNPNGGFLSAPASQSSAVIDKVIEISPLASIVNRQNLPAEINTFPIRAGLISTTAVGESQSGTESQSTFEQQTVLVKDRMTYCVISHQMIRSSNYNLTGLIERDVITAFSRDIGSQIANGNNSPKEIEGFMSNSKITSINSGSASDITTKNLFELNASLKIGYNRTFVMNNVTFMNLMAQRENGTTGAYLFPQVLTASSNNINILGNKVIITALEDMPSVATNAFPIIVGDFSFYTFGIKEEIRIIRDEITLANSNSVKFNFFTSFGGGVAVPEAFKKLKVSS
jgi:HK97 family phage major capsid protein